MTLERFKLCTPFCEVKFDVNDCAADSTKLHFITSKKNIRSFEITDQNKILKIINNSLMCLRLEGIMDKEVICVVSGETYSNIRNYGVDKVINYLNGSMPNENAKAAIKAIQSIFLLLEKDEIECVIDQLSIDYDPHGIEHDYIDDIEE